MLLAVIAVLICGIAAAVVWAIQDDAESSGAPADCALVEDVGRQWATTQTAVRQAVEQSSDYLTAAEHEATMAETLRKAVDSTSSQQIKNQLRTWADGAALFAQTQRDIAERQPGTPPAPNAQSDFINASTMINDASVALGKLCPNMPWEEST